MTTADQTTSLEYASAQDARAPGIGGPVAVLLGGLALVVLGGCFLIGALALLSNFALAPPAQLPVWSLRDSIYLGVLYTIAFACFAAAAWVIVLAVKRLLAR